MSPFAASELRSAALVAVLLALVLAAAEALRRTGQLEPEHSRKAVHVGTGLLVCAFPWLFASPVTVGLLSAGFFGLLLFLRSRRLFSAVGDVGRRSVGELLFPAAVGLLFWLSHDRPAFYLASLLVLVLPDAVAALVGRSYGRLLFEIEHGERKSLEGSFMFFMLSFLVVFLPLLLMTDLPKGPLVLVALQLAFIVACLEAICVGGVDNLVIPLASYYVLIQTTRSDLLWISAQLGIEALLVVVTLLLAWRGRILSVSGFLAAQLYLYGAFAYGDFACLLPPIAVYALFALLRRPAGPRLRPAGFRAVSFFWVVAAPFALLLARNYLVVFGNGGPQALLVPLLPLLYAAAHGAGLACVGQVYRPRFSARLPLPLRPAAWPLAGAAAALVLAALVAWVERSPAQAAAAGLGLAALVGAMAPLVQRLAGWDRLGTEAAGARAIGACMAASLGLALLLRAAFSVGLQP